MAVVSGGKVCSLSNEGNCVDLPWLAASGLENQTQLKDPWGFFWSENCWSLGTLDL